MSRIKTLTIFIEASGAVVEIGLSKTISNFSLSKSVLWILACFLQDKIFVVISISTAYNELEVSNLQTTVDTCQCVYLSKKLEQLCPKHDTIQPIWTVN